jgi:predicted dehydrogenase
VLCEEFNPSWSWYAGNAASTATFEMADGARFVFNGSWCSPGFETSWNGSWRISGERGTVLWDGDHEPTADFVAPSGQADVVRSFDDPGQDIAGSLREFVAAVRTGTAPMGEVHANVMSLAMVEAAVQSAALGRRVALDDVLNESYETALAYETNEDVLRVLKSWPSVRAALSTG